MSDKEPMAQIHVDVPKALKRDAKNQLEHGELSEVVRDALNEVAYSDAAAELKRKRRQLEELKSKRERLKRDIEKTNNKIRKVNNQITRLEKRVGQ